MSLVFTGTRDTHPGLGENCSGERKRRQILSLPPLPITNWFELRLRLCSGCFSRCLPDTGDQQSGQRHNPGCRLGGYDLLKQPRWVLPATGDTTIAESQCDATDVSAGKREIRARRRIYMLVTPAGIPAAIIIKLETTRRDSRANFLDRATIIISHIENVAAAANAAAADRSITGQEFVWTGQARNDRCRTGVFVDVARICA